MSTRSLIGVIHAGGSGIDAIWAHWDGYPSYMGRLLRRHYRSLRSVKKLIAGGDIEGINSGQKSGVATGRPFYFDEPHTDFTVFRGNPDKDQDAFDEMITEALDAWREFIYLWDEETSKWLYIDLFRGVTPHELTAAICEEY
jgi:hypothetical protein